MYYRLYLNYNNTTLMKFTHFLIAFILLSAITFEKKVKKQNQYYGQFTGPAQWGRNYRHAYPMIKDNPLPSNYATGDLLPGANTMNRKYREYTKLVGNLHGYGPAHH